MTLRWMALLLWNPTVPQRQACRAFGYAVYYKRFGKTYNRWVPQFVDHKNKAIVGLGALVQAMCPWL